MEASTFLQFIVTLSVILVPLFFFNRSLKKNLKDRSQNRFHSDSRFTRSEHGARFLIFLCLNIFVSILIGNSNEGLLVFLILISIGLLIYYFYIAVKRLHDLNMSGWYSLILFIPLANFIVLMCLFFVKGSHGSLNKKDVVPENLRDDV